MKALWQKRRKFFSLSGKEKALFTEALLLHLWVGLALKVIPFRKIPVIFRSPLFGLKAESEAKSRHPLSGQQYDLIRLIKDAVTRAGNVSPWKNKCLVSSLAGRCMLRSRKIPSELSLGVIKGAEGKVAAHAWLESGGVEIVEKGGDYTAMYRF